MPRKLGPPPEASNLQPAQQQPVSQPATQAVIPTPAEGQQATVNIRRVGNGTIVETVVHDRDFMSPPQRTEEVVTGDVEIVVRGGSEE